MPVIPVLKRSRLEDPKLHVQLSYIMGHLLKQNPSYQTMDNYRRPPFPHHGVPYCSGSPPSLCHTWKANPCSGSFISLPQIIWFSLIKKYKLKSLLWTTGGLSWFSFNQQNPVDSLEWTNARSPKVIQFLLHSLLWHASWVPWSDMLELDSMDTGSWRNHAGAERQEEVVEEPQLYQYPAFWDLPARTDKLECVSLQNSEVPSLMQRETGKALPLRPSQITDAWAK